MRFPNTSRVIYTIGRRTSDAALTGVCTTLAGRGGVQRRRRSTPTVLDAPGSFSGPGIHRPSLQPRSVRGRIRTTVTPPRSRLRRSPRGAPCGRASPSLRSAPFPASNPAVAAPALTCVRAGYCEGPDSNRRTPTGAGLESAAVDHLATLARWTLVAFDCSTLRFAGRFDRHRSGGGRSQAPLAVVDATAPRGVSVSTTTETRW